MLKEKPKIHFRGGIHDDVTHQSIDYDPRFTTVARTAAELTGDGRTILTGGGPGAMEAGNLGAYVSSAGQDAITDAVATLASASHYTDPGYMDAGRAVIDAFPDGAESVAIPTWFYGHEPTNLFATGIAKSMGGRAEVDYDELLPATVNNPKMAALAREEIVPLGRLGVGQSARISQIIGQADRVHRLEEFGLRSGTKIQMFRRGNPCIIRTAGN